MKLFFFGHVDVDGNNFDALIEANDIDQAFKIWRTEFEMEESDTPEIASEVKLTGEPRMIPWEELQ